MSAEAVDSGREADYLDQLPDDVRERLRTLNAAGLAYLGELIADDDVIAFLGAGASAPLYPLWGELVNEMLDLVTGRLSDETIRTYRVLAASAPDAVLDLVRKELGPAAYRQALRKLFTPRRDPADGRTWTTTHELVARCDFRGVVTTNYDPGIVNARMAVRTTALSSAYASWTDEDALDRWRTGDVFGDDELPILYAHGHHNQPEAIVLATTEYRRAYAGKLAKVLGRIVDAGHIAWIGFSFADQRIAAILREIGEQSGTYLSPGQAPRHVAIMPWDPMTTAGQGDGSAGPYHPEALQAVIELQFGCRTVFYPAPNGDHSALHVLLKQFVAPRFASGTVPPAARPGPPAREPDADAPAVEWAYGGTSVEHFTGRAEELVRLDRWAAEDDVRLVGVTAWGGTGKTALITQWLTECGGLERRPVLRGLFAWSFYENRSVEEWAERLLEWAAETLDVDVEALVGPLAGQIVRLMQDTPVLLVLDGLEVLQEGPALAEYGSLLDGDLRATLTGLCQTPHQGLVVLTSRFPFADIEPFVGSAARMLDVPPLTEEEGAALLERAGGAWLPELERRALVAAVDGHALALGALAGMLADGPGALDTEQLRAQLGEAGRTDARVGRVLAFYADRLSPADRQLVALVSLFQHPASVTAILTLAGDAAVERTELADWSGSNIKTAVDQRLGGLLTWHADQTISAHPLVRDAFRPLVLSGATANSAMSVALADLPHGGVTTREDGLRVVETIELLVDAGEWESASSLFRARTDSGNVWKRLPAARLGQRCATAFVRDAHRQAACAEHLGEVATAFYLNELGLFAYNGGDLATAERFLRDCATYDRDVLGRPDAIVYENLFDCAAARGDTNGCHAASAEVLALADNDPALMGAHVARAMAYDVAGETLAADQAFAAAERLQLALFPPHHLYSTRGRAWGELMVRTGRAPVARRLVEAIRTLGERNGWDDDLARADHLAALCDLAEGRHEEAGTLLAAVVDFFQAGDYLVESARALPDLAEQRRVAGDLDEAERICAQAIALAGPRQLVPSHGAALAVRARTRADRHAAEGKLGQFERARDDADHVLRLATRSRRLPWLELAASEVHVSLDALEQRDRGWAAKSATLRATLIPSELDPDPLASAEAAVAAEDS